MKIYLHIILLTICWVLLLACSSRGTTNAKPISTTDSIAPIEETSPITKLVVAAEDTAAYLPILRGKRVALTANTTSRAYGKHLLDLMIESGVEVKKVFAPEHGFRGEGEAGAKIHSGVDSATGVEVVSLFGKNLKPLPSQMSEIDYVVYDIQDVGCRFFTYISTLHNVMEAAAENGVKVIVLDRPNPNIDYVAGPVRESGLVSFVSMDPLPIVYGMTSGELAQMINGEGWLKNGVKCDLTVIPILGYTRATKYEPPIKPSPNLPDYLSIRLYPSLCLFEATNISVGRGTSTPFSAIGFPDPSYGSYVFTPQDIPGMQTNPLHKGKKCYGIDFKGNQQPDTIRFSLDSFVKMYRLSKGTCITRRNWLALLYGNTKLPSQLAAGVSIKDIEKTWEPELSDFMEKRAKYLIYK